MEIASQEEAQQDFTKFFYIDDDLVMKVEALYLSVTDESPDDLEETVLLEWFFSRFIFNVNEQEWVVRIFH